MKKLLIIPVILLVLSCKSVPPRQICTEPTYLVGRVLLAKPESHKLRTVLYETSNGKVVIYDVPMSANLDRIPVCYDYHRFIYYKKS